MVLIVLAISGCGASGAEPVASPTQVPGTGSPSAVPAGTAGMPSAAGPSAIPAAPAGTPSSQPDAQPLGAHLLATITADLHPCAMAVTATSIWVTAYTGMLDRIDPTDNSVAGRFKIGGHPCGIAIDGAGSIWVADLAGRVIELDPSSGKVTRTIDGVGPNLWDLKAGDGAVWVVDRDADQLLRIDPDKGAIVSQTPIGPDGAGLAVLPGGVWVADDVDGKLRRVDPATGMVTATVDVGGGPTWFADDGGSHLLAAERLAGKVVVVDPVNATLGSVADGWTQPLDGTVAGGQAWIPDGARGVVRVVDAATGSGAVTWSLPDAHKPFVAEPAFGDIWVLDSAGTAIWRIHP